MAATIFITMAYQVEVIPNTCREGGEIYAQNDCGPSTGNVWAGVAAAGSASL